MYVEKIEFFYRIYIKVYIYYYSLVNYIILTMKKRSASPHSAYTKRQQTGEAEFNNIEYKSVIYLAKDRIIDNYISVLDHQPTIIAPENTSSTTSPSSSTTTTSHLSVYKSPATDGNGHVLAGPYDLSHIGLHAHVSGLIPRLQQMININDQQEDSVVNDKEHIRLNKVVAYPSDYNNIYSTPLIEPWIDEGIYFVYWTKKIFNINVNPLEYHKQELVNFYSWTNRLLDKDKIYLLAQLLYGSYDIVHRELSEMARKYRDLAAMYVVASKKEPYYIDNTEWPLILPLVQPFRYAYTDGNMTLVINRIYIRKSSSMYFIKELINMAKIAMQQYLGLESITVTNIPVPADTTIQLAVDIEVGNIIISIVCIVSHEHAAVWDLKKFAYIFDKICDTPTE